MMYFDNFSLMNFFMMMLIASFFGVIVVNYDKFDISISNSYLEEYNQCQETLERTSPICPVVTCQDNSSWKMIYAFIIGLIVMFFFYDYVVFPRLMKSRLEKFTKTSKGEEDEI